MSPTQRTLAELKKMGATAQVVEKFNRFSNTRLDLFGCIDIVAIVPDSITKEAPMVKIVGIQACAGASHAARRTKSLSEPKLEQWLKAGGVFEVWSWAKRGERGKRKLWTLRREEITLESFMSGELDPIEKGECTTLTI